MLEGWMTLAALARETNKVRLGTLVTGVTYRNPALLAKEATTLDVISGGRAIFGLGAAWNDVEHAGYGYDFPPIRERMDRLEEALAIAKAMFTEEPATFHGKHYKLDAALNEPRPVQPKGPPILIGGVGEQRTLRIAAKYADMTHWFALGIESLLHKTEVLEGYCDEIGRDPSTIERTVGAPVMVVESDEAGKALLQMIPEERRPYVQVGTPDKAAEALQPYIDAGFTGFTFNNNLYRTPDDIARLGEVLRLVTA
jgi:F420-dependent oxidoreductase-like protein